MKPLSRNAVEMPRSGIRVILDLAANIPDAIHLEIGQPDFVTPAHICDAATRAMVDGYTGYTPNAGYLSLREAIVDKLAGENKIKVGTENIVVTTGGMGGLFSAFSVLMEPGDEILLPDPGYPNYEMVAVLNQYRVVKYPLDIRTGFLPDLDSLARLITSRTKVLMVNSPSNPTGAVFPASVMESLLELASQHDLYILSDECYERITFDTPHFSPYAVDPDGRVVSVFSFSKSYAMTGWRVGFVVASQTITPMISKLQEATVACASSISQKAAEAALLGPQDCVKEMVESYHRRRDVCLEICRSHGLYSYIPQGAFYLLIDISSTGLSSEDFAVKLLQEAHVAVAPGATFGILSSPYIRVSLASNMSRLKEGISRICRFIQHK